MVDVVITYETLFDILRKEKSRQELQELPSDFYGQVVAYLRQKQQDVDRAGGMSSPSAQKAMIQFKNIQKILRELYERRERKLIEMALNRARAESNIVDTTPILDEEKDFYATCAELFTKHREQVLSTVMNGDAPPGTVVPERAPVEEKEEAPETDAPEESEETESSDVAGKESCNVRFVGAVPKFLGLKGEVHGPFEPGDTAELPGKIAAVLVKKKRVELA